MNVTGFFLCGCFKEGVDQAYDRVVVDDGGFGLIDPSCQDCQCFLDGQFRRNRYGEVLPKNPLRGLAGALVQGISKGHDDLAVLSSDRDKKVFSVGLPGPLPQQVLVEFCEVGLRIDKTELKSQNFRESSRLNKMPFNENFSELFLGLRTLLDLQSRLQVGSAEIAQFDQQLPNPH